MTSVSSAHEPAEAQSAPASVPVIDAVTEPAHAEAEILGPPVAPVAFVVEDDESIGYLLAFILEREGFKVEWKTNGKDADRFILRNEAPRIVLLDVNLPDIDGYGLLRIIRAHPAWQLVPVLMLTALSQPRDVAKAISDGADDYLLKPFHPAELAKRVHKLCRA
jgi:DNA-binding response OmpR family regulator